MKPPTTLKNLCETRRASRYRAVHAVKEVYDTMVKILRDIDPINTISTKTVGMHLVYHSHTTIS